jgi:hypothetical protein
MTRESVLNYIERCDRCGVSYIPTYGEICNCPDGDEEPRVTDYEDVSHAPDLTEAEDE